MLMKSKMSAPTTNIISRLPPVKFAAKQEKAVENSLRNESADETCKFNLNARSNVKCVPFILEFRRLLQSPKLKSVDVIPGVPNQELLHAVVALYDVCLPDITPEVLYDTVAGKAAKTFILIRDPKEVLQEFQKKSKPNDALRDDDSSTNEHGDAIPILIPPETNIKSDREEMIRRDEENKDATLRSEGDKSKTIHSAGEKKKGMFADVFSDTDSETVSDNSDEEDEDFSKGVEIFLTAVKERREKRNATCRLGENMTNSLGIENRLVACATWEKSHIRPGEKITLIDLIAVRKRFRKMGIGLYLLQNLKDPSIVGLYDSLVVYSDHSAIDFFANFGFTDDIVLNSKYSELADNWTNCQLMCYLPPYTGHTMVNLSDDTLDLKVMEMEIQKWTEKSRESYQAQYGCLMRLRHEVIALKALVSSQQDLIENLSSELHQIKTEKFHIEKDFLHHKIKTLKDSFSGTDSMQCFPDNESDYQDIGDDDDNDTDSLINKLEQAMSINEMSLSEEEIEDKEIVFQHESIIDEKVAEDFKYGMLLDPMTGGKCVVTKTTKANLHDSVQSLLSTRLQQFRANPMSTNLYWCGTLEHPDRITDILKNGFADRDMSHGDYGVGLYFTQHPSKAAHFSTLGKMVLVEVVLGKTESVPKPDRTRTAAPLGYHSIITPGRLFEGSGGDVMASTEFQEFVIFDPLQAKPLFIVEYVLES